MTSDSTWMTDTCLAKQTHLHAPSQHVKAVHHRPASETPLKWRFAGGPIVTRYYAGWVKALEELAMGLLKSVCFRVREFTLRLNAFRGKSNMGAAT